MSNNIFSGAVPLNLRKDPETVKKSVEHDFTSYRDGVVHKPESRSPHNDPSILPRNNGNTPLRRFPNGQLDVQYVAQTIVSLIHKIQDGGNLTEFEKAIITLILPEKFNLMDKRLAGTMARLSDNEKIMVAFTVHEHFKEELGFNAGRGSSIEDRHITRS